MTDLLMRDRESKKEIDYITTACLDQLKLVQEKHGENITSIRNQAEKCFTKDYLVSSAGMRKLSHHFEICVDSQSTSN